MRVERRTPPRWHRCRSGRRRPAETAVNGGQTVKEATSRVEQELGHVAPVWAFTSQLVNRGEGEMGGESAATQALVIQDAV